MHKWNMATRLCLRNSKNDGQSINMTSLTQTRRLAMQYKKTLNDTFPKDEDEEDQVPVIV